MEVFAPTDPGEKWICRDWKLGVMTSSGGGRLGVQAAELLCDRQDAERCTARGPKPLAPWRQ